VLWISGVFSSKETKTGKSEITTSESKTEPEEIKIEPGKENVFFDKSIDSVLFSYGIKKEWISTVYASDTSRKSKTKKEQIKFRWFTKTVQVPKDVNGIELNSGITDIINLLSLNSSVEEDIRTKNFVMMVSDTSKQELPLAKISINFSDKIERDDGVFVILLKITKDYTKDEVTIISADMQEFSVLITPQREEPEIINLLKQSDNDIILAVTCGDRANYSAEFRNSMGFKEIREKVKLLYSDFPFIKTVLLLSEGSETPDTNTINQIITEYKNFQVKVINDKMLTIFTPEETKDNSSLFTAMRIKVKQAKKIIFTLEIPFKRLNDFYESCSNLRKLGYKFYAFNEYIAKEEMLRKKELEQQMKKEQEKTEQKEKDVKKTDKKKPEPTKKTKPVKENTEKKKNEKK
jgi:hypothetical protein